MPYAVIAEEEVWYVGEQGEQWLFAVRPELVTALAGLEEDSIPAVAARWAQTDELDRWDAADLADLLTEIAALARFRTPQQQLYFWGSL